MALSLSQIKTNINNAINHGETTSSYLATRIATLETNLLAAPNGVQFARLAAAAKNWRNQSGIGVSPSLLRPMFNSQLDEIRELLNKPLSTPDIDILYDFRDYLITSSESVKARNVTLGTPAADGSNTGTGELVRLKVDDNDQNIESINIESQRLTIIGDQSSPNSEGRHNELAEFSGSTGPSDFWAASKKLTSGLTFQTKVSSESDSILSNSSFDAFTPFVTPFVGPLTGLTGWTIASGGFTNLSIDTNNYFTSNPNSSIPASLKFTGSETISQKILLNTRILDRRIAWIPIVYYNRQVGSFSGTLAVHWGSVSQSVALAAQTGWNRFAVTLDKKLYPKNWLNDEPEFKIVVTRISGDLLIDKIIFRPMVMFNNTPYILLGGSTPFKYGDFFTWSNALVGSDSIIQKWFAILTGISLPHDNAGTHTWAEPTIVP